MARTLMAVVAAMLCLAGPAALAQSVAPALDPEAEVTPLEPMGPIVDGKHLQPTLSDIMERQALRQPQGAPAGRGRDTGDKELDELYEEVLRLSQPQP
jgi:hypothetical protein